MKIFKTLKKSNHYSLKNILILCNGLILTIFFVAIFYLYNSYYHKLSIENIELLYNNDIKYIRKELLANMKSIEKLAITVSQNFEFRRALNNYEDSLTIDEKLEFLENVSDILSPFNNSNKYISSINVLTDKIDLGGQMSYSIQRVGTSGIYSIKDFDSKEILKRITDNTQTWVETRPFDLKLPVFDKLILSYYRRLYSGTEYYDGEVAGYLMINLKETYIYDIIKDLNNRKYNTTAFIFDDSGNVISSSDRNIPGTNIKNSGYGFLELIDRNREFSRLQWNETENIIGYSHIPEYNWHIAVVTTYDELFNDLENVKLRVIIISLALLLICITACVIVSYIITRPIIHLSELMRNFTTPNPSYERRNFKVNEICIFYDSFNKMNEQIGNLIKELHIKEGAKRRAELTALQAQINPHFLYNTLESINWMALSAKQKNISRTVLLLGNIMRLSLNKGKNVCKIQNELDHLRSYIEVQKIRFEDKFEVIESIDKCILDLFTVKLILQPIVENAIQHGFERSMGMGRIEITGKLEGEDVLFVICDNGCGINGEKLENILKKHSSAGYGICNVHERIQLYFGRKYGLHYDSVIGEGTTVRILVPRCEFDFEEDVEEKHV